MATKVKPSRIQISWTPQAWCVPVYVNEDCFCRWAWGGWWGGCSEWWCITGTLCDQTDLQWALDCKQDKACMVCNLTSPDNNHYPTAKAVADAMACAWVGDMLKSVYDPNNVEANVYDYCNFTNTPTIPTDNCQLANSCGYTTCTWTLTSSNISNVVYGSSWSGVVTDAPSKKVMYDKLKTYDAIIPSAATCSNQLADKDYVNDSINSVTAYYITKNAQGDQFACYAELAAATVFYSWWVQRVPTRNDYTIVADDECYSDATTRYVYNSGWEYQYTVNETPLTTAQLNALNSGITAAKVTCYDTCMAQCCDIPTNNCQLTNWCGYTTCTWTLSSCADVISALWYTPYNSTNPNGYTTCTWTVTSADLASYVQESCVACINWCCLTQWGNICIQWWGWGGIQLAPNSEYDIAYHWYWPQSCYNALSQYYTCCANDTAYFTTDE